MRLCREWAKIALALVALSMGGGQVAQAGPIYGVKTSATQTLSVLFTFDESQRGPVTNIGPITDFNGMDLLVDGLAQYRSGSPILGFSLDGMSSTPVILVLRGDIIPGASGVLALPIGQRLTGIDISGAAFDNTGRLFAVVNESSNPSVVSNSLIQLELLSMAGGIGGIVPGSARPLTLGGAPFTALGGASDISQRLDGTFFLGNASSLYTLDINTGALSFLGTDVADPIDLGQPQAAPTFSGLAFDSERPLTLFTADSNGNEDIFTYSTDPFDTNTRFALVRNIYPFYNAGRMDLASPAAIPEPGTYMLVLTGLGALGFLRRRSKPLQKF